MLIKAPILRRDHRVLQLRRNFRQRHERCRLRYGVCRTRDSTRRWICTPVVGGFTTLQRKQRHHPKQIRRGDHADHEERMS